MRRSVVAIGIAGVSLGAAGSAVAALASGSRGFPRVHPPVPRVSTLGVTRAATLVSYCWTVTRPDGAGSGVCADGSPGNPAHTLSWRPGAGVRIDLRLPGHHVQVEAVRITGGIGGRPSHAVSLRAVRADPAGRRWTVRLPRRSSSDTDLLISARFAHGDVASDLGIAQAHSTVSHRSGNDT